MLNNIVQLIKENAGDFIQNNPDIPEQKKEAVIQTTAESIKDSFAKESGSGLFDLGNIASLLKGGSSDSFTGNISSNVQTALISKLGLSPAIASSIASMVIPMIMKKFLNSPNESGNVSSTGGISSLGGGAIDKLKGLF